MNLAELVATSLAVAATSRRLEKIDRLAALLRAVAPDEGPIAFAYLCGEPRQDRLGIGHAAVREALAAVPEAFESALTLGEVDATLGRIAAAAGRGSGTERARLLAGLMSRAGAEERDFLARLLTGELRQGAHEGLVAEALAKASGIDSGRVRRALMLGNRDEVARAALAGGETALARFDLQVFRPVQPMLAQTAAGIDDALARLGEAALEHKLDGARVQVHRSDGEVRVYSRSLNDVTAAVPDVVAVVRGLGGGDLVLDGEVLALAPGGRPFPFQTTMRRFGRRLDVERLARELPLRPFFFDLLHLDGASLIDSPGALRFAALVGRVGPGLVVPRLVTADPAAAAAFLDGALAAGHEGILAKSTAGAYEAGARGLGWLKVKPAHTLDLVVLAVEWGSGRREGLLSNLHLGARDPQGGGFVMLGKTFKGMTDEMLAWQTERLLALELGREGHVVHVRPELVVEVAFDGVQASPRYPGGVALRFARVKRYREDKRAAEADTIDAVRAIHQRSGEGGEG